MLELLMPFVAVFLLLIAIGLGGALIRFLWSVKEDREALLVIVVSILILDGSLMWLAITHPLVSIVKMLVVVEMYSLGFMFMVMRGFEKPYPNVIPLVVCFFLILLGA